MSRTKSVIVVPTIRVERISEWLEKWKKEFENSTIIIVEDNPETTFHITQENVIHYSWKDIDSDLGDKSWIIPKRTAAVRSYGFIKAFQMNPEYVITLDDDCYPESENFVKTHEHYLNQRHSDKWIQHAQSNLKMRGVPKNLTTRECVLNMGLWANVPDLDGNTQKENPDVRINRQEFNFVLSPGQYAPISSMNMSFKRKVIPALYFLLMGSTWGFDRFDDIWSGIFIKRICDHLGFNISGGSPFIWHDRASNPDTNIQKEATGLIVNEHLWKDVENMKFTGKTFKDCYLELANQLSDYQVNKEYWPRLREAMVIWANLF
ncbi:MAG TPA: hypothetical protein PK639_04215 [Candidatus Woesebacteria bacterium]|nr:hypothetical protein [Candidatus Woesebacteria bacterium]